MLLIAQSLTVGQSHAAEQNAVTVNNKSTLPFSDQSNKGGWVLNDQISDEFDGTEIDQQKWFVQGANNEYYIWKGRAPSQFAPHNVILDGGILKLRSQWEPNFKFAQENYADGSVDAKYGEHEGKPFPVTTAAIVSNKRFLNGYMEVRSKAVNAAMTSAFWAIGYQSELDIYEQMGNPKIDGDIKANLSKSTVHDWSPPAIRPTRAFHHKEKLPFNVADEFHVYGAEWGEDYLNLYLDGNLIKRFTQKELGDRWVLTRPLEIWLDSEIFSWLGMPNKEELPADFEIDYVRVWQKPTNNLLDKSFFGFEGPKLFEQNKRPLKLVPENSQNNEYQKFWDIDAASKAFASITNEKRIAGTKSLKIATDSKSLNKDLFIKAPKGAVTLDAGTYVFSTRVWVALDNKLESFNINLGDTHFAPFMISKLDHAEKAQWITLKRKFTLSKSLPVDAQLLINVNAKKATAGNAHFYIDDMQIIKLK